MATELPIFQDNLKSSAGWNEQLAAVQPAWVAARAQGWPAIRAEQVAHLAQRAKLPDTAQIDTAQIDMAQLAAAAELITTWANEAGSQFTSERLLTLHRTLLDASPADALLRTNEPPPLNAAHDPTPAILLARMLDNAFDWFSTEGFGEMHAVEQAAVVFLRLLDLHPFTSLNETTALLATSFYLERAGWPPLVIYNDDITTQRFANVTETAFRMLTQPLVEFLAEMLQRAMRLATVTATTTTTANGSEPLA